MYYNNNNNIEDECVKMSVYTYFDEIIFNIEDM